MADYSAYDPAIGDIDYTTKFTQLLTELGVDISAVELIQNHTATAIDTATGGSKPLNLLLGDYFYTDTALLTNSFTFQFQSPRASGSTHTFRLELLDADVAATITWPATVDWEGGTEPSWTATTRDIAEFTTRDGGATWYGRRVYTNLAV